MNQDRSAGVNAAQQSKTETQSVIVELADGNDTRFASLFIRFAPKLKSYLVRLGVTPAAAEELAQETMLRVWRKASRFDPNNGDGVAWIYRIARNLRIDAARREHHADELSPTRDPDPPTPEDLCLSQERDQRLEAALLELSPIQAEMLRRSLLRQGTLAEIAQELDLPLSTAKSHLRRAISQIRKRLDQEL